MSKKQIEQWLDNPTDYSQGLKLYHRNKINNDFDNFFKVDDPKPDSMQFKILIKKLHDIVRKLGNNPEEKEVNEVEPVKPIKTAKENETKPAEKSAFRPRITDNPIVNVELLPKELQTKYFDNKKICAEMQALQSKLKTAASDQERKEIMKKLTELDTQNAEIWEEIDKWWKENGETAKDEAATDIQDNDTEKQDENPAARALEINNRIKTVKINITRAVNQLPKTKPHLIKKKEDRIKQWKAELNDLEKELKEIEN